MQKENLFFFSFPRRSNFGNAKVTKKSREMQKENLFFFSFPRRSNFGEAKVTKKHLPTLTRFLSIGYNVKPSLLFFIS